jgi:hypothetical protein
MGEIADSITDRELTAVTETTLCPQQSSPKLRDRGVKVPTATLYRTGVELA